MRREPRSVLLRIGPLAAPPPKPQFQLKQPAQESRTIDRVDLPQVVFDPRRLADAPLRFEAFARRVNPLWTGTRAPGAVGGRTFCVHGSFSSQVWRIVSSSRFTTLTAQPIFSAISFLLCAFTRESSTWRRDSVLKLLCSRRHA
jgi:hypothetical protein